MFLNAFPGRARPGQQCPPDDVTYFDFTVFERPVYVPRSTPLSIPTPMPVNDKDGIILDFFELGVGNHRYLVGYIDKPNLKVSVKMINILHWVSEKTFEEWHWQRTKEKESRMLNTNMHWKKKTTMGNGGDSRAFPERGLGHVGGKKPSLSFPQPEVELRDTKILPGIGLISRSPPQGPGRRRRISAVGPHSSLSQPSLLSPPNKRQRGLAETTKSESEEIDEDNALAMQLNIEQGASAQASDSRSSTESRHLSNASQYQTLKALHPQSRLRDSSRSISSSPSGTKGGNRKTKTLSPTKPPAERRSAQRTAKSFIVAGQLLPGKKNTPKKRTPTPAPKPEKVEDEDEEHYELVSILDDKVVTDEYGTRTPFYLIRWQGDWDDTWEPSENVGHGARNQYRKMKRAKNHKKNQNEGKGTKRKRDQDDKEEGDDNGLESDFLAESGPEKEQGRPKRISRPGLQPKSPAFMNYIGDQEEDVEMANTRLLSQDGLFISRTPTPANFPKNRPKVELYASPPAETSIAPAPAAGGREMIVIISDEESDADTLA